MTIRLWLIKESEKAYLFSRLPPEKFTGKETVWIGRSLVKRILKFKEENGMRLCEVDLPEWLIEKENL